jgi:hypothetical protein
MWSAEIASCKILLQGKLSDAPISFLLGASIQNLTEDLVVGDRRKDKRDDDREDPKCERHDESRDNVVRGIPVSAEGAGRPLGFVFLDPADRREDRVAPT